MPNIFKKLFNKPAAKIPPVAVDESTPFRQLQRLAEADHVDAQLLLGQRYDNGLSPDQPRDYDLAAYWYRRAAKNGSAQAHGQFAYCCLYGKGVTRDVSRALHYLHHGERLDDALSLYLLGRCYAQGVGVVKNVEQAKAYYQAAARLGEAAAKEELERL